MCTSQGDSQQHAVEQGVPSGKRAKSAVFNVVMAKLPALLSPQLHVSIYADYICIWCCGACYLSIQADLKAGIDSIEKFLRARGMDVLCNEIRRACFHAKEVAWITAHHGWSGIPREKNVTSFLVIYIDTSLTWCRHMDYLQERASRVVHVFALPQRHRWGCSSDSMLRTACLHLSVRPLPILYLFCMGLSNRQEQRLQALVTRGLRLFLGVPRPTSGTMVLRGKQVATRKCFARAGGAPPYLRLTTQHDSHPLVYRLQQRSASKVHQAIFGDVMGLPADLNGNTALGRLHGLFPALTPMLISPGCPKTIYIYSGSTADDPQLHA
ncbi:hypothetical protein HPB48_020755 [Haemaphysalis longicornis]|uniref:Reverse transcriptase domain-containing protein n=1 Tax=Haemaphysalis longicornis TaxID=44386 RepID=A0A9J6H3P0_HAELO|nr:hypothetical protein HPB48_020755 [Haemaphysalis longicornis]